MVPEDEARPAYRGPRAGEARKGDISRREHPEADQLTAKAG